MRLFSRPRSPSRHTVLFQVREALERERCALCRLSLEAVARYLDGLAYEDANDPVVRDRLRASRGFCPRHAWQIARLNSSALDVAIIYRDVLGEITRLLESRRTLSARLLPQGPCPACAILAGSEDRHLGTLLDHLPEPDFAAVYRASEGLCLPHLILALSCSDPANGRFLAQMEAERVWDLAAELNEFVRKNDYRFRDEPWGREATSPWRSVGLMVGAEGSGAEFRAESRGLRCGC